jgi:hypothetical protein
MSAENGADARIRFLGDENFRDAITRGLRRSNPQIDVLTAAEAGMLGRPDPQVLAYAADLGRMLLTHDKRTVPDHYAALLVARGSDLVSPGVIVVPQDMGTGQVIEELTLIWEASRPEEWNGRVIYLPL